MVKTIEGDEEYHHVCKHEHTDEFCTDKDPCSEIKTLLKEMGYDENGVNFQSL